MSILEDLYGTDKTVKSTTNLPPFEVTRKLEPGEDPDVVAVDMATDIVKTGEVDESKYGKNLLDEGILNSITKDSSAPISNFITTKVRKPENKKEFLDRFKTYTKEQNEVSKNVLRSLVTGAAGLTAGGLSMLTPITLDPKKKFSEGESGVKLRNPSEMAKTAMDIAEEITYIPKDKVSKKAVEDLMYPITWLAEQGNKKRDELYKEAEKLTLESIQLRNSGDVTTAQDKENEAKVIGATGLAYGIAGEAAPFLIPGGLKSAIKAGNLKYRMYKVQERGLILQKNIIDDIKTGNITSEQLKGIWESSNSAKKQAVVDELLKKYRNVRNFTVKESRTNYKPEGILNKIEYERGPIKSTEPGIAKPTPINPNATPTEPSGPTITPEPPPANTQAQLPAGKGTIYAPPSTPEPLGKSIIRTILNEELPKVIIPPYVAPAQPKSTIPETSKIDVVTEPKVEEVVAPKEEVKPVGGDEQRDISSVTPQGDFSLKEVSDLESQLSTVRGTMKNLKKRLDREFDNEVPRDEIVNKLTDELDALDLTQKDLEKKLFPLKNKVIDKPVTTAEEFRNKVIEDVKKKEVERTTTPPRKATVEDLAKLKDFQNRINAIYDKPDELTEADMKELEQLRGELVESDLDIFDEADKYTKEIEATETAMKKPVKSTIDEKKARRNKIAAAVKRVQKASKEDKVEAVKELEDIHDEATEQEKWDRILADEGLAKIDSGRGRGNKRYDEDFDTGFMGSQYAHRLYESVIQLLKESPTVQNLTRLGKNILLEGVKTFKNFTNRVKVITGDLFNKVKNFIREAWDSAKVWLKETDQMSMDLENVNQPDHLSLKPTLEKITKIIKSLNNEKGAITIYGGIPVPEYADVKQTLKDTRHMADEYLGSISTRLSNIHPSIKYRLRRFEYTTGDKITKYTDRVLPFIKATNKMSAVDYKAFDMARKNGDPVELKRLVTKYNIGKEYHDLMTLKNELRLQAKNAGYKSEHLPNHHPRELKDINGFLDYMYNTEDGSSFDQAIRLKEKRINRDLTPIEKAKIINSMLRGYSSENVTLGKPGQLKHRTIKEVTADIDQFYNDSNSALLRYINDVITAIEAKKLFGFTKESEGYDINTSIGNFILKNIIDKNVKITPSQERELKDILKARFNEVGTSGLITTYKNFSYADTMGSPTSAITQLGDVTWAVYKNGLPVTIKSFGKAVAGNSKFTKKDLGVEKIAAEFSDKSKSAKLVDTIFTATGLTKIDAIGKEVLISGAYDKAVSKAKSPKGVKDLRKELQPIFEEETDSVISDFQNGRITENVKLYLFNVLTDFQPISLSEMPQKYLTGGNGRVFYMLKTFTLKSFDVFRRECFSKIANKGTRLQGMKNLLKLASIFVAFNATSDVIQNLLLGRPIEISDVMVDNLMRVAGASRYTASQASREGFTGIAKQILPPFKLGNALIQDIKSFGDDKGFEMTQSIPLVGKLYYWWFGKGAKKLEKKEAEQKKKEGKGILSSLKSMNEEGKSKEEIKKDRKERKLTTLKSMNEDNDI